MKNFSLIVIIVFSVFLFFTEWKPVSENPGIQFFEGSWKQALTKAKKEHKPIFLDISASWCAPCKKMKKETFTDKEASEFYNKNFINVSVDGEKGYGIKLADRFKVYDFPALFFIDENDKVILRSDGFKNAPALLELGKKVFGR